MSRSAETNYTGAGALLGAAAGAAITALLFTVLGGPSSLATPEAGEPHPAEPTVAPAATAPARPSEPGTEKALPAPARDVVRREAPIPKRPMEPTVTAAPADVSDGSAPIVARAEAAEKLTTELAEEVAQLRKDLERAQAAAEETKTYDLSNRTLRKLAAKCELRWDHPGIRVGEPAKLDDDTVKEAGLTPEQAEQANTELAAFNARSLAELRRLYTAVTGDEEVANLAPEAMFAEINDKSEKRDLRLTFEKLAAERAGLAEAPPEGAELAPVEQLYRYVTRSGDDLEHALAGSLGAKAAKALRDVNNGWGSRSRSSYGCPKRD